MLIPFPWHTDGYVAIDDPDKIDELDVDVVLVVGCWGI